MVPAMRPAPVLLAATVLAGPGCDDPVPAGDPEAAPDALLREVIKRGYGDWTRPPKHDARIATNAPHGFGVEVFVDDAMAEALANADGLGRTQWPEGGTIVLRGFAAATVVEGAPPDEPVQIAIMQKHGGTWRWEQYQAGDLSEPRSPRFHGRPDVCVGCHVGTQDFVRGFSLPKPVEDD